MFMSTTDDRNHIGNEWSHDKKLSEVDVWSNDTKHTKMFISRPFGNSLDMRSVTDLSFFCPRST